MNKESVNNYKKWATFVHNNEGIECGLCCTIMIVSGFIFFFLVGEKFPGLQKDSGAFINYMYLGYAGVMPGYPLFLRLVGAVCVGELENIVYIPQGILAMVSTMLLSLWIRRRCSLNVLETVIIYTLSLMPFAYTLPEYVVTHSVMSEGISFSVFYIALIFLIEAYTNYECRNIVLAVMGIFACILVRSQFVTLLGVLLLIIYCNIQKKEIFNRSPVSRLLYRMIPLAVLACLILTLVIILKNMYGSDKDSQLANSYLGKAMTIARREDSNLFEKEDEKLAFESLFFEVEKNGYSYGSLRKDLLLWEDIVNSNNESMKLAFDELYWVAADYLGDTADYYEKDHLMHFYMNAITSKIILSRPLDFFLENMALIPSALLSCVFIQKREIYSFCFLCGLAFYCIYILLMMKSKNRDYTHSIAVVSLIVSLVNAFFLCFTLFGIQRYMVYSMGMMYISLFLMIRSKSIIWRRNDDVQ